MPAVKGVYKDPKNEKWFYQVSLGYDEKGVRVRKTQRGFRTQKEAKKAYDNFMVLYTATGIVQDSTMKFKDFYTEIFEPYYKTSVSTQTYNNRISSMRTHFKYFDK